MVRKELSLLSLDDGSLDGIALPFWEDRLLQDASEDCELIFDKVEDLFNYFHSIPVL
jgi:hypothetical protein